MFCSNVTAAFDTSTGCGSTEAVEQATSKSGGTTVPCLANRREESAFRSDGGSSFLRLDPDDLKAASPSDKGGAHRGKDGLHSNGNA